MKMLPKLQAHRAIQNHRGMVEIRYPAIVSPNSVSYYVRAHATSGWANLRVGTLDLNGQGYIWLVNLKLLPYSITPCQTLYLLYPQTLKSTAGTNTISSSPIGL